MQTKKISELDPKDNPTLADIVPIVDTELTKRKTKRTTIGDIADAIDAVPNTAKGQAGGVATLDQNSRLPVSQLPGIAVTETFNVNSEVAMLALSAQMGDIAIRDDINVAFILQGQNATVLDNWVALPSGSGAQTLEGLSDVADTIPTDRAVLVFDPDTNIWRPAKIERLTDGGDF